MGLLSVHNSPHQHVDSCSAALGTPACALSQLSGFADRSWVSQHCPTHWVVGQVGAAVQVLGLSNRDEYKSLDCSSLYSRKQISQISSEESQNGEFERFYQFMD